MERSKVKPRKCRIPFLKLWLFKLLLSLFVTLDVVFVLDADYSITSLPLYMYNEYCRFTFIIILQFAMKQFYILHQKPCLLQVKCRSRSLKKFVIKQPNFCVWIAKISETSLVFRHTRIFVTISFRASNVKEIYNRRLHTHTHTKTEQFILAANSSLLNRKFRYKRGLAWPFSTSVVNQPSESKQLTNNGCLFL